MKKKALTNICKHLFAIINETKRNYITSSMIMKSLQYSAFS